MNPFVKDFCDSNRSTLMLEIICILCLEENGYLQIKIKKKMKFLALLLLDYQVSTPNIEKQNESNYITAPYSRMMPIYIFGYRYVLSFLQLVHWSILYLLFQRRVKCSYKYRSKRLQNARILLEYISK